MHTLMHIPQLTEKFKQYLPFNFSQYPHSFSRGKSLTILQYSFFKSVLFLKIASIGIFLELKKKEKTNNITDQTN